MKSDPAASLASLLREQKQQGNPIDALQTLVDHPDWWTSKSVVLDLAYEEFCQRRESGEGLDPDQFCARFPVYQSSLRRTLEMHQFVEENPAAIARLETLRWPEPGEEFLGFRLEREVGRGAFARVFQATETAIGQRAVAVKVSLQGAAEADTLGKLEHPHIVPILSVHKEQATGLTVVCMPYLGSATLCDVLDRVYAQSAIPSRADILVDALKDSNGTPTVAGGYIDTILRIALGMAEAMVFMHARGICHRDLKPSNVLLTSDGRPMLLDFNLAFDAQKDQHQIGGTLPYMSPEHLIATDLDHPADSTIIGPPSDVFSVGVMLYELLTGMHPFGPIPLKLTSQELRKVLLERQQAPVAPIRRRNRWVDRSVAKVVERCLGYNPRDRCSAEELVSFFCRSLSPLRRMLRWVYRHRWSTLATTACLAGVVATVTILAIPKGTLTERAYARGLEEYNEGRWAEAAQFFDQALAADQQFTPAILGRAHACQRMKEYHLAVMDYAKLKTDERDGEVLACLAYCTAQQRSYPAAIGHLDKAIAKGYETPGTYNNLGWCYLRVSDFVRAQDCLNHALQLNDRLQVAYHNRARVERQLMTQSPGRVPLKGIEDVRRAMELGPITTDLAFDAAYLCTFAAKTNREWIGPALEYLALAIQLGHDPKEVSKDVMFKALATEPTFAAVLKTPPRQSRQVSSALVDPLDE